MTPEQIAKSVLGLFGLGPSTRVCPGGRECTCGRGLPSPTAVDLREDEEARA